MLAHKLEKNQKRFGMGFSETDSPEQMPTSEWVMMVGKFIPLFIQQPVVPKCLQMLFLCRDLSSQGFTFNGEVYMIMVIMPDP